MPVYSGKLIIRFAFMLIALAGTINSSAQVIDHTSTFKSMGEKYIRLHYDNDYFTKTDEFYTQGITLEYAAPGIRRFFLTKLLLHPVNSTITYGVTVDHYVYTPTSIRSDNILFGDRPFCANLSASLFSIASNAIKNERISSSIILGVMGPGAGGREMQTSIHRWLKNVTPHGWQYQIKNDIILDYEINYEKKLWSYRKVFLLNVEAGARIGTHNDNLKTGFNFMIGHLNDPYGAQAKKKKFTYYLYGSLKGAAIGYDATLQGGLINRNSPYTIRPGDIKRVTLQGDYGLVMTLGYVYLEYCQSILTREYATGTYHRWGGVRLGIGF